MKRRITLRRVPEQEFIESLKLNVPDPNSPNEYVRIGPGDPLYHGEMAKRTAQAARAGNTDAALEILRDFVGAIDQYNERTWNGLRSAPIHWAYVQYIAEAFEKILRADMHRRTWPGTKWGDVETGDAEADANRALGITSSKAGRRKGTGMLDREALAAAFNLLLVNGLKPERAKQALQERIGAQRRTIEKANNEHIAYQIYARHALRSRTSVSARDHATQIIKVGAAPYQEQLGAILRAVNASKAKKQPRRRRKSP